jgi:hypothetical protein
MLSGRTQNSVAPLAWALSVLLFFAGAGPAWACTLFGLAGPDVAGGGTLLVKNRDWRPNQTQRLALVVPEDGHRYLGLFADGGRASGLKAGVNAAGLTVVSATAGSVPREARRLAAGMGGVLRRLLHECGSVAEAVARTDLFSRAKPCFYMLSDRRELARIEIGPGGRFAVTRAARGALWQTNHYLEPALAADNHTIGVSSWTRAARIEALLDALPRPANLAGLLALSRDSAGGPDNGIWRTGGAPTATRTLATFAVAMPPAGPGTLSLRLADPGMPERVQTVILDAAAFAGNAP